MKTARTVKELNIIIAGVGGQGIVLMSEIIGEAAVHDGINVRGSEVLGMAQRGGSVFSNIRLGSDVLAPLTAEGKGDVFVALEPSESLRNIQYLNESSIVIMNIHRIIPVTVSLGQSLYPEMEKIMATLYTVTSKVVAFDAIELAGKAGNILSANSVMLGALFGTGKIPVKIETVKASIRERFPAKTAGENIRAFNMGYNVSSRELATGQNTHQRGIR